MATATDTVTAMSSIMDTDKFTTVTHHSGGSPLSPPKQRPQSRSPLHPGNNIKWINPFDDKFSTSFSPLVGRAALTVDMGNPINPDQQKQLEELMALASPGGLLIVGAGQDGHAKNTPRGVITKIPNDAKYSSLPLFLVPPFVGDQGDLDPYIGNLALRKPAKKVFRGGQASVVTATLLTSSSTSLVLAPLGGSLILSAGQDGHAKNTPQGGITNNSNEAKYSSLPLSLIFPGIGDQGDLDPYISNPALHHPTKKAFRGDQALSDTAAFSSSTSASLALAPLGSMLKVPNKEI